MMANQEIQTLCSNDRASLIGK